MIIDNCDCECKGVKSYTPVRIYNPSGLSSISYRVGTHGRFKAQMVSEVASESALEKLTTRSDSDLSIALLDSWATIADVLTFYQERIANEGFLRTAIERRSVLELARSIGYELRPGVSASTYLAFKLDPTSSSPKRITIEAGTKVQSIPGKDETPQVFETSMDLEARQGWSEIRLQQKIRQDASTALARGKAAFEGTATRLRAGDGLLFVVDGSPVAFRIAREVELDAEGKQTVVTFESGPASGGATSYSVDDKAMIDSDTNFTGKDLNLILTASSWHEAELEAKAELAGWSLRVIVNAVNSLAKGRQETKDGIYAFRVKCGVFGHNAPMWKSLPDEMKGLYSKGGWDGIENDPKDNQSRAINKNSFNENYDKNDGDQGTLIYLDNTYPTIQPKTWIALKDSNKSSVFYVKETREDSLTEFSLINRAIGLNLGEIGETPGVTLEDYDFRKTTVYAQPEQLALADIPVEEETVCGQMLVLEEMIGWLQKGQPLLVEGELADSLGTMRREIAIIKDVTHSMATLLTTIEIDSALAYTYRRDTVAINANVAKATHGETKEETIGSGDPSRHFQSFNLKQSPLTFVSDSSPSGAKSTLTIKIDSVTWREVSSFEGLLKFDNAYVTHTNNESVTRVIFGDGTNGKLPPSGFENIKATYRVGIGTAGLVGADKLTLLMKRPLGVKSVTNPLAATGASDPEKLDDARKNAPRTVLTLDRIVSIKDYADFARGFAGVGKSVAYEMEYGGERVVLVAIASSSGDAVNYTDMLYINLKAAIESYKDPTARFLLRSYNKMSFDIRAKVLISKDRDSEIVKRAVKDTLKESFSFESRAFGQAVSLSEVVSVIQGVGGVEAVDIEAFHEHVPGSSVASKSERIIRATPVKQEGAIVPSLLLVNNEGITLEEMAR